MSNAIDNSQSGQGVDTQGNWLTRNFWFVKGVLAAGTLLGLAYASLAVLDHEMSNVLWAICVTMAVLVVVLQGLFGAVQVAESA